MSDNDRKTAVITGGAGGLGLALADKLLSADWRVCLIDLPGKPAQAVHFQSVVVLPSL